MIFLPSIPLIMALRDTGPLRESCGWERAEWQEEMSLCWTQLALLGPGEDQSIGAGPHNGR